MKHKIILTVAMLSLLCVGNVQAKEIEYTTDIKGNNVQISGTAEPNAELYFDVPDVYSKNIFADDNGDFDVEFKLPLTENEYEYTLKSLDFYSYFVQEKEDFYFSKDSYTKNTATRDLNVGNIVPSLHFTTDDESRFVWTHSETVTEGFWGVSADFLAEEGSTAIFRVTNSIGNYTEVNTEINHLADNVSSEAFRIDVRNGKLRLYYLDNNTNQTLRTYTDFADVSYGEWHNINVRMNIDTLEIQVYFDNERVMVDKTLYMASQLNFNRLFDTTTATAAWNLDNIKIEKNITSGTLVREDLKTAFDAIKRSKKEDLKSNLIVYKDFFTLENVSEKFWNDDNIDNLYNEIQKVHKLSDVNKAIAMCDITSDIDNITESIKKYPSIFAEYGLFNSIINSDNIYTVDSADNLYEIIKELNDKYSSHKGTVSDYSINDDVVSFTVNASDDVNIRLLDGNYEVFNNTVAVSSNKSYSLTLPKNGLQKRYLLVIEDIATYLIDAEATEDEINMFYKDDTSGNVTYPFENKNDYFTVETSVDFGHGAPSRFIDSGKRFIVNPQGVFARGYYTASADFYISTCDVETDVQSDLWSILDDEGKCFGARLYIKNNVLILECENNLGEIENFSIMPITFKQWYNLSVEIAPDNEIKLFVDGKFMFGNGFLKSDCKNGLQMINIDTRNSKSSLYIDNIILYENYFKESLGFYNDIILDKEIDFSSGGYWTSSDSSVTTSNGKVYHNTEDTVVKLTALSENGVSAVYFVTVTAGNSREEIDLKSIINFDENKLPLYTNEYQKIAWSVKETNNEIVYTAYVGELDKSCEFKMPKSVVSNKKFKITDNTVRFSADVNEECTIMLAFFDSDDNLVGFGNGMSIPENAEYCEAFVWENTTQSPLTESSRVYISSPNEIYVIFGKGKTEDKIKKQRSNSYISDLDSYLWFFASDIFESVSENIGFIDARDCNDMSKIYSRIQNEYSDFKGVIYIDETDDYIGPFEAIETCRKLDELHKYLGEFQTVAPTRTNVFNGYNNFINAIAVMRSDFIVVDTGDLIQIDEFEYTSESIAEIGRRINECFKKNE